MCRFPCDTDCTLIITLFARKFQFMQIDHINLDHLITTDLCKSETETRLFFVLENTKKREREREVIRISDMAWHGKQDRMTRRIAYELGVRWRILNLESGILDQEASLKFQRFSEFQNSMILNSEAWISNSEGSMPSESSEKWSLKFKDSEGLEFNDSEFWILNPEFWLRKDSGLQNLLKV